MTTVHRELLGSSLAAGFTACLFSPIECVKTRLQVQEHLAVTSGQRPLYRGFIHATTKIATEDGLRLFWQHGFVGFVGRDLFYSGIRIGAYPTVRKMYAGNAAPDEISLLTKIAAGMSTGAFGSAIANPFDVLRVRHCTEGGRVGAAGRYETGLRTGHRPTFTSSLDLVRSIYKSEGIRSGLWKGTSATMTRAAFLSGSQLASYDHSKTYIKKAGIMSESTALHLLCATFSGLVATTCCNPPDVVKSRLMLARAACGTRVEVGPWDVICSIFRESGIRGFFKGWTAAYARAGPAYFIQMPITETLRRLLLVDAI